MKNYQIVEHIIGSIEEEFQGYEIHIENNPDQYSDGYQWSVSKDNEILDSGLVFSIASALSEAQKSIIEFNKQ